MMKRRLWIFLALLLVLPLAATRAWARVEVNVDLSTQRMHVKVDGMHYATWRISSGQWGYFTPRGTYRPLWLKRMHYSSKYDNAPMPYSIFFRGGYAIHGTNHISRLGRPASHGCIRLHPAAAAKLFRLVQKHGRRNTIIRITGSTEVAYARLRKSKKAQRRIARRRDLRRKSNVRPLWALRRQYRDGRRHHGHEYRAGREYRPLRRDPHGPSFDFFPLYEAMLTP